ncbi:MAG: hypothetical protein WD907_01990 [Bacilli bacterium]
MRALEDGIWEQTPERIHTCFEEIEQLTQLVTELEQLIHMESPEFRLIRKNENLDLLIEKGVGLVSAAFTEKKERLTSCSTTNIQIYIDHDRIHGYHAYPWVGIF